MLLGGLMLLGVGGATGWFAARHFSGAEPTPAAQKPVPSIRLSDPAILDPALPWETWQYPGSKVDNSSTGGGFTSGAIEFGATERIALVTPDDFDKVWAFYKDKCQLREPGDGTESHHFEGGGAYIKLFDDIQAHSFAGPKSDLLAARAFTVQSLRYQLVGFVYRPKGAASTCILLAYRPNKEFTSLLKERAAKE
jgi:hypothetical protein